MGKNNLLKKELEVSEKINKQLENEYNQLENNLQKKSRWINYKKNTKLQKNMIPIYIYLEKCPENVSEIFIYNI